MPTCPKCESERIVKNGHIHNGKQRYKCKDCGRQFVENPTKKMISQETWDLVDKLLLERISLAGISRVTDISEYWLQQYVNKKYEEIPKKAKVSQKKKGSLDLELDEMWSFVGNKDNKQWIWWALDGETREIVGLHVGSRSRESAQALWDSLPGVYRQCAVSFTDFYEAYEGVIPSKRHHQTKKGSGMTNAVERFNCTVRQRLSRLVRKALSFSKKLQNHIGAIWNFVHHYNETLNETLLV